MHGLDEEAPTSCEDYTDEMPQQLKSTIDADSDDSNFDITLYLLTFDFLHHHSY